jgi:hypothetical protein
MSTAALEADLQEAALPESADSFAAACERIIATVPALVAELAEAKWRLDQILATIYEIHSYLDADGEIDTAAKFRAIERLAHLDWDTDGIPR